MSRIIGLVGVKGSGKTTAAEHINLKLKEYKIVSFADKLKEACSSITKMPFEHFEKQELKEAVYDTKFLKTSELIELLTFFGIDAHNTNILEKFSGTTYNNNRQLMQIVGTDILRSLNNNIHVESVLSRKNNIIVPDVRFENEAIAIDASGGYLIYIHNPEAEKSVTSSSHASEKEVLEKTKKYAHFIITNDGKNLQKFINSIDDTLFDIAYYIKNM